MVCEYLNQKEPQHNAGQAQNNMNNEYGPGIKSHEFPALTILKMQNMKLSIAMGIKRLEDSKTTRVTSIRYFTTKLTKQLTLDSLH